MPSRKTVKTLKNCCCRIIALRFESYFMKEFNEHFKDMPRILYVNGPFDQMTNETIQGIIDHLVHEQKIKRNHLSLLLQESVVDLNLSGAKIAANNDWVLTLVSLRCQRLVKLNLTGLKGITSKSLSDCLREMSCLKSLILCKTSCNDQVLSVLGHHCLDLQELDLRSTPVQDPGIFSLCQACKPDIGCKKLNRLVLDGTAVTMKGTLHALQNLPKLQVLDCDNIYNVIAKDIEEKEQNVEFQPYKLKKLDINGLNAHFEVRNSDILRWFPNIQSLMFLTKLLTDSSVQAILNMKFLSELHLSNLDNDRPFSYQQGVVPILEGIGSQMTKLALVAIPVVDLISVGHFCRNLKSLSLTCPPHHINQENSNLSMVEKRNLFKTLEDVYINCAEEASVLYPKSALIDLLKAAKTISRISLIGISFFNADDFLEIYKENPLSQLTALELYGSSGVEKKTVLPLLVAENELRYLGLYHCKDITRANYEDFQKIVDKKSLNLKIVWT